MKQIWMVILLAVIFTACKKDKTEPTTEKNNGPYLIMKFDMDSTMMRVDNFGNPSTISPGNAAQSPIMHLIGAHYVEFTPNEYTLLGDGDVVYNSPKTSNVPGEGAIIFDSITPVGDGETFLKVPLKNLAPGTYKYIRVSIAYENYDITYHIDTIINVSGTDYHIVKDEKGTIANFIGFNNYISTYTINGHLFTVNAEETQGYWGFASNFEAYGNTYPIYLTGEVPPGATTVPNVLASTSPIPPGSCIITGGFSNGPLSITGKETKDITIRVKISTNNGFEWEDINGNGKYDPIINEHPVDMGIRGIQGVVE